MPTARAEALIGPVQEALELIRGALDAPLRFDPATDRRSFRLSCSDYSVLMLIGLLVRALAADAPGSSSRSCRGSRMPVGAGQRRRRPGHRAAGDHGRHRPRVAAPWDDRWECCVWEEHARGRAHDHGALHRARPPHLLDGRRRPARRAADLHMARLGVPRRIEVSVESFLLAPFLLQGTDLVTLIPSEPRRSFAASATSACSSPDRTARARRDALVAPARDRRPGHARRRRGSARSRTRSSTDRAGQ